MVDFQRSAQITGKPPAQREAEADPGGSMCGLPGAFVKGPE